MQIRHDVRRPMQVRSSPRRRRRFSGRGSMNGRRDLALVAACEALSWARVTFDTGRALRYAPAVLATQTYALEQLYQDQDRDWVIGAIPAVLAWVPGGGRRRQPYVF